jgi:hypothetical protein
VGLHALKIFALLVKNSTIQPYRNIVLGIIFAFNLLLPDLSLDMRLAVSPLGNSISSIKSSSNASSLLDICR